MSEVPESTPESTPEEKKERKPQKQPKEINPGPKMRAALVEVQERLRRRLQPAYKIVAAKHDVSPLSLRLACWNYKKGLIKLGLPSDQVAMAFDIRTAQVRAQSVVREYKNMLYETAEILMQRNKKFRQQGKALAFMDLGLPKVFDEIKKAESLETLQRKDMIALMREVQKEKDVNAATINVSSVRIDALDEDQRAKEIARRYKEMREAKEAEIVESETPPDAPEE